MPGPWNQAAECISDIVDFILYICVFPAVTCQTSVLLSDMWVNRLFWIEFDVSADERLLWLEAKLEAQCYVRADRLISCSTSYNDIDERTTVELLVHASVLWVVKISDTKIVCLNRLFTSILTQCLHQTGLHPLPVSTLDMFSQYCCVVTHVFVALSASIRCSCVVTLFFCGMSECDKQSCCQNMLPFEAGFMRPHEIQTLIHYIASPKYMV